MKTIMLMPIAAAFVSGNEEENEDDDGPFSPAYILSRLYMCIYIYFPHLASDVIVDAFFFSVDFPGPEHVVVSGELTQPSPRSPRSVYYTRLCVRI